MSVIESNISTTIRCLKITDDIRIEVKKFRTDAGIDQIDILEDEDDISVMQKIAKTFSNPNETKYDPAVLKSIITRLEGIEKNLESIIYMNAEWDSIWLLNHYKAQSPQNAPTMALPVEPMQVQEYQGEEYVVLFPINQVEELRELDDAITIYQESFITFVNFLHTIVQKHCRNLEPILLDFVTDSLINELGFDEAEVNMMSFCIFNQLLYDVWKTEYSTIDDYQNRLRTIACTIQNRYRAASASGR